MWSYDTGLLGDTGVSGRHFMTLVSYETQVCQDMSLYDTGLLGDTGVSRHVTL